MIPRFESLASGLTFKFWKASVWADNEYRNVFINFIVFHILLLMILWCFGITVFSDPGPLNKEYFNTVSIIKFYRTFFEYILKIDTENFFEFFKEKEYELLDDLSWIIENETDITNKINEIKKAFKE